MPSLSSTETYRLHGCRITLRKLSGAKSDELFLQCEAPEQLTDAYAQAVAMYSAIGDLLDQFGGGVSIVTETIFLSDAQRLAGVARQARAETMIQHDGMAGLVAPSIEIGQRPLAEHAHLEIVIHALSLQASIDTIEVDRLRVKSPCRCDECKRASGTLIVNGHHKRLYTGAIYGAGDNAYEQTLSMFEAASHFLSQAGMQFSDVARTWIYLREMERDYPLLNKARREFFGSHDISMAPASTGIGASLVPEGHDICLALYAEEGSKCGRKVAMKTPTLNEAPSYGADFSRGSRVASCERDWLFVSGTASLDEAGHSVYPGDVAAQADRMLLNISELLKAQGADYNNILSAVSYVKHAKDGPMVIERLKAGGFLGFPLALVEAEVCRPELLCETEVFAVLPHA